MFLKSRWRQWLKKRVELFKCGAIWEKICRKTVGKIKDLKFIEISPSVTECYTTKGKILRKKSIFKDISLYFKLTCIVSLRIQSECGKIRTRKTLDTSYFHAVLAKCDDKVFWRVLRPTNWHYLTTNSFLVMLAISY